MRFPVFRSCVRHAFTHSNEFLVRSEIRSCFRRDLRSHVRALSHVFSRSLACSRPGPDDRMDTPKSIGADDVSLDRLSSGIEDLELDSLEEEKLKIAAPMISNPFSGDEGSPEASSPESLSPNAPADDFDDDDGGDYGQHHRRNPLDDHLPIVDAFTTTKTTPAVDEAFLLGSPDAESGFAELSAAAASSDNNTAEMPVIDGVKDYRALAEVSSGEY